MEKKFPNKAFAVICLLLAAVFGVVILRNSDSNGLGFYPSERDRILNGFASADRVEAVVVRGFQAYLISENQKNDVELKCVRLSSTQVEIAQAKIAQASLAHTVPWFNQLSFDPKHLLRFVLPNGTVREVWISFQDMKIKVDGGGVAPLPENLAQALKEIFDWGN